MLQKAAREWAREGSSGEVVMYLGLDLGTSGLKALLIDADQRVVASASAPLTVQRPVSGWSEQDPASWLDACDKAISALDADLSSVRGIGLSGHMHGATLLGADEKPLRPCMLWNDTRSATEAAAFDADPQFRTITGNIVFPGFTAPKVDWVRNNEPDIFAKTRRILLPKDYLRLWLTGEAVSDMSDASGTSWLDVGKRDWSGDLLAACHLDRSHMPSLVEGSAVSAHLRADLASRWGMNVVPVAGGGGDNAASAIGLGTVQDGAAFVSLGTSGVLFAANDGYKPNPESAVHAFCHALPGTWHQMGVILSATDALNWWAGVNGTDAAALTAEVLADTPEGPLFLPYLAGERTPHNDASIRGSFIGLDHSHTRATVTRSVMEGVAFALADSKLALVEAGTDLSRVLAVGGGSASHSWLQIVANALALPVDLPADGEFGAAFGAARLGLLAAEKADPAAICTSPATARTFEPSRDLSARYGHYRDLYSRLNGALQ